MTDWRARNRSFRRAGRAARLVWRSMSSLAVTGVSKSHAAHVVLAGIDLVVPPRARIGLVGPNGAGKSTLLRLLAGVDAPDSGSIARNGAAVGYLPQERDPRPGETVRAY